MLKFTLNILYSLLYVSVHLDHLQGAYTEPGQSYTFVEIISRVTSCSTCYHNTALLITMYLYWLFLQKC